MLKNLKLQNPITGSVFMTFSKIKLKEILFLQDFGGSKGNPIWINLGIVAHPGIDINVGHLDPIYAFSDGEVVYVSEYGDVILIDDEYEYTYSHLDNIQVKQKDKLKAGDLIGYQNSSGKSIQGADWTHLHFMMRRIIKGAYDSKPLKWNFKAFSHIPYAVVDTENGYEGYISPDNFQEVIVRVAKAIEKFEGNTFGNNPGNLRWSPFQSETKNGFAVFLDYAIGWKALIHQLTIAANGKSKWYKPTMKVLDFCKLYAPVHDNNNPENYAKFIIDYCGFRGNEPISDWLLTELEWVKKYNNVSRGRLIWVGDNLIKAFNRLWGLIFRDKQIWNKNFLI